MLREALNYLSLGLSVIPLRPRGKEPLISWTEFQSRRASEIEVVSWFQKWPTANLGSVTGAVSGVCVVDLDGPEGIQQAEKLGLSSSIVSLTGNGKHLWYKHPGNSVQNAVKLLPGVDLRGDAGYVVAPPSIHENGKRYRWLGQGITANTAQNLPSFPLSLLEIEAKPTIYSGKEEGWIAKALEDMKDGNIDNTLVSILGRMRHDNWSADDAKVLLRPHMGRVGAEPGHLEAKIENIWKRYAPAEWGYEAKSDLRQLHNGEGLVIHTPTNPDDFEQFESTMDRMDDSTGFKTGFKNLDSLLQNGLKSERLFTIAALTGQGKTNFGIALSRNLCEQGKSVLYFSTEFGYKKIWTRYISTLKNPANFREHQFHVCDGFTPSIEQVEEAITRIKPDVFIFDYIQHVSKEKEKLTEFMKGCQFLQRKYETQGIILAQLNRSADWVENGKRVEPRLSMIEGSATIEQASSRVLLLSMTRSLPEYHEIQGYLAKNDDGDTGMIQFGLYRNPYHLEEL